MLSFGNVSDAINVRSHGMLNLRIKRLLTRLLNANTTTVNLTRLNVYDKQFGTKASVGECILCFEASGEYVFCEYCSTSSIDAALRERVLTAITWAFEGGFDISVANIVSDS